MDRLGYLILVVIILLLVVKDAFSATDVHRKGYDCRWECVPYDFQFRWYDDFRNLRRCPIVLPNRREPKVLAEVAADNSAGGSRADY